MYQIERILGQSDFLYLINLKFKKLEQQWIWIFEIVMTHK